MGKHNQVGIAKTEGPAQGPFLHQGCAVEQLFLSVPLPHIPLSWEMQYLQIRNILSTHINLGSFSI